MSDFDLEGLFIEPRPDEDGWEAFLDLALERIGGDRSPGLTNRQIGDLEAVLGCRLPFEVGLLLVMGVPAGDSWHQWSDPEAELAAWNDQVVSGFCFDIEHNHFWFDGWGSKPATLDAQLSHARSQLEEHVPQLFPIFGNCAAPLTAAHGQSDSDANPVFSVDRSAVIKRGDDLAAWMHAEFDVPLPMWPAEERHFDFWSDLSA